MKRTILFVLGALAVSIGAVAQSTPDAAIERALSPAPRNAKEAATVIKWKADGTYETLKKGTNRLVCYDRSGDPGEQPFSVQCTSLGNLDRVAQGAFRNPRPAGASVPVRQGQAKLGERSRAAQDDGAGIGSRE